MRSTSIRGLALPHELMISEDEWIKANVKLIRELGPGPYLPNLLSILKGDDPATSGCFPSSTAISAYAAKVLSAATITGASKPKAGTWNSPNQGSVVHIALRFRGWMV